MSGDTIIDCIKAGGQLAELCALAGRWHGQYTKSYTAQPSDLSWSDYLKKIPDFHQSETFRQMEPFLQSYPVKSMVLSRNDGSLRNLILTKENEIKGIDLEGSQYKPLLWDLGLTARAFVRYRPQETSLILSALSRGFAQTAPHRQLFADGIERFQTFLGFFVLATAFEIGAQAGLTHEEYFRLKFNETAPQPASYAGRVPFNQRIAARPGENRIVAFTGFLNELIAQPETAEAQEPHETDMKTTPVMAAGCMACKGQCCHQGGETNAFINHKTIAKFRVDHPTSSPGEIAAFYLSYLPELSYQDSCLYHSTTGCTLPRFARAEICNRFICNSLKPILEKEKERGHARALLVAEEDGQVMNAVHLDKGGPVTIDVITKLPKK